MYFLIGRSITLAPKNDRRQKCRLILDKDGVEVNAAGVFVEAEVSGVSGLMCHQVTASAPIAV